MEKTQIGGQSYSTQIVMRSPSTLHYFPRVSEPKPCQALPHDDQSTNKLSFPMNSLSRREEETLLKITKAHALRECDVVVKGTALC